MTSAQPGTKRACVDGETLARVLETLRERTGVDFRAYRQATIERRVHVRMMTAGAATCAEYLERLRADRAEAARLVERLTIKVSSFLRNPEAFAAAGRALAARAASSGRPLTLWSAGCAYGEEAFGLAMLLSEAGLDRAWVLATDIDRVALERARRGVFPLAALEPLPAAWRARYFEPAGGGKARVRAALRERIRWEEHDLTAGDSPARGLDFVSCRNTLIYFSRPLQEHALGTLEASLAEGGLLWLGEAEWMSAERLARYEVVDRQSRLFRLRTERRKERE